MCSLPKKMRKLRFYICQKLGLICKCVLHIFYLKKCKDPCFILWGWFLFLTCICVLYLKKCKDLGFIFVKNLSLFVNVCCVFSTSKMKILGALYLLKTWDLVFKRGCQRTWASNPKYNCLGFCKIILSKSHVAKHLFPPIPTIWISKNLDLGGSLKLVNANT